VDQREGEGGCSEKRVMSVFPGVLVVFSDVDVIVIHPPRLEMINDVAM